MDCRIWVFVLIYKIIYMMTFVLKYTDDGEICPTNKIDNKNYFLIVFS